MFALRFQPMISPNGTANRTARANPQVTRNNEATTYFRSSPCCNSSPIPVATAQGVGNIWVGFRVTANCHRSSRTAMSAMGRRRTIKSFDLFLASDQVPWFAVAF